MLRSVVLSFALHTIAIAWTGKVIGVADGDTIKVMKGSQKVKIRLYGVDTPEKRQHIREQSKKGDQRACTWPAGRGEIHNHR